MGGRESDGGRVGKIDNIEMVKMRGDGEGVKGIKGLDVLF